MEKGMGTGLRLDDYKVSAVNCFCEEVCFGFFFVVGGAADDGFDEFLDLCGEGAVVSGGL